MVEGRSDRCIGLDFPWETEVREIALEQAEQLGRGETTKLDKIENLHD